MDGQPGIERHIGSALLLLLAVGCLLVLRPFLSALLWAALLCFASWPLYQRLERLLGGRRTPAAMIMVIFAATLLLLPLVALGSRLASELTTLTAIIRGWIEHGLPQPPDWLGDLPVIGRRLDDYWQVVAVDGNKLAEDAGAYVLEARSWILAMAVTLGAGTSELALSLIIAFFLYRDGMAGVRALRTLLSRVGGNRAEHLTEIAGHTIKGVIYGVLGTNLVMALLGALGLWIAGVPSPLLLGFAVFFLTIIPGGPIFVFVPAILWLVGQNAMVAAIFLAAWYLLVFTILEGLLRAYFISRGSDMPVILVFFGMLGGVFVFGLLGIFVGPTLLAVGYALVQEWSTQGERATEVALRENEPAPSRLHY
jgi:predicted PurR-regulated permease PerM